MLSNNPLEPSSAQPEPRYAPISVLKLSIMWMVTFGVYSIVWFYRNWRYIKHRDDSTFWATPRAVINPITYLLLIQDLNKENDLEIPSAAALLYLMWNFSHQLPDPYWLISIFSFVCVLPAVVAINRLNEGVSLPPNAQWRARDMPVLMVGGVIFLAAVSSTIGVIPSTLVVEGSAMRADDVEYLRAQDIVNPDEDILFFYSTGVLSIEGEGSLLTDQRVISYWTDPITNELMSLATPFAEIVDVEINEATNTWLEDTIVRVNTADGDWYLLFLSSEEGGDKRFLEALDERRERARDQLPKAGKLR